jgi:hypothetical protein
MEIVSYPKGMAYEKNLADQAVVAVRSGDVNRMSA